MAAAAPAGPKRWGGSSTKRKRPMGLSLFEGQSRRKAVLPGPREILPSIAVLHVALILAYLRSTSRLSPPLPHRGAPSLLPALPQARCDMPRFLHCLQSRRHGGIHARLSVLRVKQCALFQLIPSKPAPCKLLRPTSVRAVLATAQAHFEECCLGQRSTTLPKTL